MPTQGNSKSGSGRGFSSMDEKKQRDIASKGGKASHAKGTGHELSSSETSAGRKGGQSSQGRRGSSGNSSGNSNR